MSVALFTTLTCVTRNNPKSLLFADDCQTDASAVRRMFCVEPTKCSAMDQFDVF